MKTIMPHVASPTCLTRAVFASVLLLAGGRLSSQSAPTANEVEEEQVVRLSQFDVTATKDSGYRASNSVSATRINTPISELPLSIEAFTEEFIQDLKPRNLLDIVTFAPGISSSAGDFAGGTANYNIRGFASGNPLRNGFKGPSVLDPSTIARVEVVRGPSSLLYGQLPPGGLVNYITKRPLTNPETTITQRVGSYSLFRTELDTTGPVGLGSDLYFRFNAAYDSNHQFYDPSEQKATVLSPVLQWRTENSTLTLDYQYYSLRETPPIFMKPFFVTPGFQFLEKVPGVPQNFSAMSNADYRDSDTRAFVADWTFRLADWDIRAGYAYARQSIDHFLTATLFVFDTQRANPLLSRTARLQSVASKDGTGQVEAARTYVFGSSEFKILAGYQVNRRKEYFRFRSIPGAAQPPAWELYNPSTWNRNVSYTLDQLSVIDAPARIVGDNEGVYFVGHLSLFEKRLGLLGGLRHSSVKNITVNESTGAITGQPIDVDQTSPQIGAIFQIAPQLSVYASYSESFVPTGGVRVVNGVPAGGFNPTIGKGYDVGLKAAFADGRVSATLAFFDLENTGIINSLITGVDGAGSPVFTTFQSGVDGSRGVEFSGVIVPSDAWQFLVSYGQLDAKVRTDRANPARQGLQLTDTARNYANFWGKYTFKHGTAEGLYLAAGLNYTGKRLVHISNQNLFWEPLTLVQAAIGYSFKWQDRPMNVDLSCKNLFNEEYFPTNNTRGDPRLLILSVSAKF